MITNEGYQKKEDIKMKKLFNKNEEKKITVKGELRAELARFARTDTEVQQCVIMIDNELLELSEQMMVEELATEFANRYSYLISMRQKFIDALKESTGLSITRMKLLKELQPEKTDWWKYTTVILQLGMVVLTLKHEEIGVIGSKMFAPMLGQFLKKV
jgi:hypothetical protein